MSNTLNIFFKKLQKHNLQNKSKIMFFLKNKIEFLKYQLKIRKIKKKLIRIQKILD